MLQAGGKAGKKDVEALLLRCCRYPLQIPIVSMITSSPEPDFISE